MKRRFNRRQFLEISAGVAGATVVGVHTMAQSPFAYAAPLVSGATPVSLSSFFNNHAIGKAAGQANFDGSGYAYPSDQLPQSGSITLNNVPYLFPDYSSGANDNVVALGQTITLPQGHYQQISLLTASGYGPVSGTVTIKYTDNSTSAATLYSSDWYNGSSGLINASYRYTPSGTEAHAVHIYANQIAVDASRTVASLTLPNTAQPAPGTGSLHVFALTLLPSSQTPVALSALFNNHAIGNAAGQANFDGSGYAYPGDQMPQSGSITLGGIAYLFPNYSSGANDNVAAVGQTITLPQGQYQQVSLLTAASYGPASGTVTINYTDGSSSTATLNAPDWYSGPAGAVDASYRYSPSGTDQHAVHIYAVQLSIDPSRTASSLVLPNTALPAANTASLHVFALTLIQTSPQSYAAQILSVRSTTRQIPNGSGLAQVVEAVVQNAGTQWFSPSNSALLTLGAANIQTVVPGVVSKLAPGEQTIVEVGITKSSSIADGTQLNANLLVDVNGGNSVSLNFTLTAGTAQYTATDASIALHEAPDWFRQAKFGIFIHWGVYSVPAWAPVGKEYAEWYWHNMDDQNDPTYQHQLQTYGANSQYDDFIAQFTAANFNPQQWVQLFQQAGAKYFVQVSKHHDGFALFQTQYSHRNSVEMEPKEDLVKKLFDAAATYAPELKRGLYYSLPEWYNPAYAAYNQGGAFAGGPPKQFVTGAVIPYTGYIPVNDYVQDFQKPQLLELINQYQPDDLWADIGGPNDSLTVLANYLNQALASGQQVTFNDRFGISEHDYTTPEYASNFSLNTAKWEATRGIDPFSFGYNAATPDSDYATSDQLIQQLVDIVSKNGNFLLDIGPEADGTVPSIMQQRLQEMGAWLSTNGEAIYNTTYWWRAQQDGNLRFTISPNQAFYIISLVQPGNQVVVNQPVPIKAGDSISLLGYSGGTLSWTQQNGSLTINVPQAAQQSGQSAWVFKVTWS
jgi:alpha-L-fucosidase